MTPDAVRKSPQHIVLSHIDAAVAIKAEALYKELENDLDTTQIANALYNLRQAARAVRDESDQYTITARGKAWLQDGHDRFTAGLINPDVVAPKTGRQMQRDNQLPGPVHIVKERTDKREAMRTILEQGVTDAQDYIEKYLRLIGDPKMVESLLEKRRAAQAMLDEFNGMQPKAETA